MKYKSYNTVCFKVFLLISVIIGCLFLNNVVQAAEEYSYGDFKYSIDSTGNVTITGYSGSDEEIIIPDQIDGKTVTSVGSQVFVGFNKLTKIKIPSGLTNIGYEAFYGCSGLTSIEIPSGVTFIGGDAFHGCSGLTSIEIPSSVTAINSGVFSECSGLTSINIPSSVTGIGQSAFYGCSGLTSINIPSNVKYIGPYAFYGCSGLTSIENHSRVTAIGHYIFYGCSGLTSFEIPSSVTAIERYAFSECSGLTSIEIPSSVTAIGSNAFHGCSGLTSIEIPSSVTELGQSSFCGCSGLTSIEIPSSVTEIGQNAFSGCSGLTSIEIPSGVTAIGSNTFHGCSGLTSIEIPSSVTAIGSDAFSDCSGLTSIEIPSSVTEIGQNAFSGCSGLTSIEIPSSVTTIGSKAFHGCSGLTSIGIPSNVTVIYSMAFYGCSGLTSIEIPSSVTTIGSYAFRGCSGLTSIEIPSSVTTIGSNAFAGCSGLTSIEIPSSVTEIGNGAFAGCSGLTSIEIPSSVTVIEDGTFSGCKGLTSIEIQLGVTAIGSGAFYGCSRLTSIEIPSSVTEIGSRAFQECSGLASIEIPSGVTKINAEAFQDCRELTSIEIPSSVTVIEDSTFKYCRRLTSIEIPSSVTRIGIDAFYNCGLKDVYYLGEQTEWENISGKGYVSSSATIHYNSSNPNTPKYKALNYAEAGGSWNDYTYWNIKTNQETNDIKLGIFGRGEMPEEFALNLDPITLEDLNGIRDTFPWKDYREMITTLFVDNDLTLVSRNTFADMHNLSIVEIPSTVKTIEENAFYGDTSISEIHYQGTEAEWNSIIIESGNETLAVATVICNYNAGWREAQGPKFYQSIDYVNHKIQIDGKEYYYAGCMLNSNSVTTQASRYIYYKVDDDGIVYAIYRKNYTRPKKKKTVITIPDDVWSQSNYSLPNGIPDEYFNDLFYSDAIQSISSFFNNVDGCKGKNGLCLGFAYSTLLFSRGILNVNDLYYIDPEDGTVFLCDKLSDAKYMDITESSSAFNIAGLKKNGEDLTVKDLWYYAYIYQKEAEYSKQYKTNRVDRYKHFWDDKTNRFNQLLNRIKYEIDTYGSCCLGVETGPWNKIIGHALLAVGYDDSNPDTLLLQIYDCNYGTNNNPNNYIEFYIDNGSVYDWKYVLFPGQDDEVIMSADNSDISFTTNEIALNFLPWLDKTGITYDVKDVPPLQDSNQKMISISGGKVSVTVAGVSLDMNDIWGSSNGMITPLFEDENGNLIAWFDGDNISVEAEDGVVFSLMSDTYELVNQLPAGASMTYESISTSEEEAEYTISVSNPTNEEVKVTFTSQDEESSTITVPANEELQCTGNGESIEEVKPELKYFSEWVNGKWYDKDGSQTYPYTLSWKSNKKGKWVVDSNGWYPKNQWQKIDGVTYFFKADGYMASNEWCKNYWINADGSCSNIKATWKKDKKGYWFGYSGWYAKNQWQMIDGYWYYFKSDGYMASNEWCKGYWLNKNGTYTYAGKASWKKDSKGWYYIDNKGWYAKKQWQKIDGKWYYFDAKGYIITGTKVIGGKTYRFNSSGVCLNP